MVQTTAGAIPTMCRAITATQSIYKKLWYYLYDELTNKYGCTNLIWVWNGQNPEWYPGDEYVDVIGEDIYAG